MVTHQCPVVQSALLRGELVLLPRESGLTQEQVAAELEWSRVCVATTEGTAAPVGQPGRRSPKAFPLRKDSQAMFPYRQRQSTSGPDPGPHSASVLTPAVVALSFTIILIQVRAAAQGSTRDLLPILIAALLMIVGGTRSNRSEP